MFDVGTILAGKYRVDRVLGQGGMGVVVAATHIHLHQQVAIKFLLPDFVHDPGVVERFSREARASAQLRGEHVCRVTDVGALDTGSPYIVMELLTGRDLASMVSGNGPLPIGTAADYVLQACLGLAEAHALGIVHRDLKPGNLFLTKRPEGTPLVKVLDFGIAKAQSEAGGFNLTQTASVIGSPAYMSPEQLRSSKSVDARSDVWALGVILYELATGRPPFIGESITDLALHIGMDPTPMMPVAVPHGFDAVVYRCLEKDVTRRFQDVAALAAALVPFGGPNAREMATNVARVLNVVLQESMPAMPVVPIVHSAPSAPTTLSSSSGVMTGGGAPRVGKKPPWAIIGAAGVTVAAVIAVVMVMGGKNKGGDASAPAAAPVAAPPPAPTPAPAPTPPPPAAAVVTPPIDAAVAAAPPPAPAPPIDAAAATAVAVSPPPTTPPPTTPQKPKPHPHKPATSSSDVDLGASRQ